VAFVYVLSAFDGECKKQKKVTWQHVLINREGNREGQIRLLYVFTATVN